MGKKLSSPTPEARPSRPPSVTLLAFGVLSITVLGLLRLYLAIREWRFLASWPGVSPLYLAATGLLVGLLGGLVFWAILTRQPYAMRLAEAAVLTLALGYWLDQIFVADHAYRDPAGATQAFLPHNWMFTACVTAFIIIYTILVARSHRVKAYFGDNHE